MNTETTKYIGQFSSSRVNGPRTINAKREDLSILDSSWYKRLPLSLVFSPIVKATSEGGLEAHRFSAPLWRTIIFKNPQSEPPVKIHVRTRPDIPTLS